MFFTLSLNCEACCTDFAALCVWIIEVPFAVDCTVQKSVFEPFCQELDQKVKQIHNLEEHLFRCLSVQRFPNPCEVFTIPWISRQPMTMTALEHPKGRASEILIGCFEWWLDFKMTWGPNIVWHLQHPQATGRDINLFIRARQIHLRFDRSTMISGLLVKPCRPRQIWPLPRRPLKKMYLPSFSRSKCHGFCEHEFGCNFVVYDSLFVRCVSFLAKLWDASLQVCFKVTMPEVAPVDAIASEVPTDTRPSSPTQARHSYFMKGFGVCAAVWEASISRTVLFVKVASESTEQDAWHLIGKLGVVSQLIIASTRSNSLGGQDLSSLEKVLFGTTTWVKDWVRCSEMFGRLGNEASKLTGLNPWLWVGFVSRTCQGDQARAGSCFNGASRDNRRGPSACECTSCGGQGERAGGALDRYPLACWAWVWV